MCVCGSAPPDVTWLCSGSKGKDTRQPQVHHAMLPLLSDGCMWLPSRGELNPRHSDTNTKINFDIRVF